MSDQSQTPTSEPDDPADRPSQGGVLGGSTPHTDTSDGDPVPQEEQTPGKPDETSG